MRQLVQPRESRFLSLPHHLVSRATSRGKLGLPSVTCRMVVIGTPADSSVVRNARCHCPTPPALAFRSFPFQLQFSSINGKDQTAGHCSHKNSRAHYVSPEICAKELPQVSKCCTPRLISMSPSHPPWPAAQSGARRCGTRWSFTPPPPPPSPVQLLAFHCSRKKFLRFP